MPSRRKGVCAVCWTEGKREVLPSRDTFQKRVEYINLSRAKRPHVITVTDLCRKHMELDAEEVRSAVARNAYPG